MFYSEIKEILTINEDVKSDQPPSWICLKGLAYDCGSKLQISSKFVDSQIGPRNHFCGCFRVKSK